ncbi:MAG: GGDEF domain-containing protein, partial [Pseudomonadales bacterium]
MQLEALLELDLDRYLGLIAAVAGADTVAWLEAPDGALLAGPEPDAATRQYPMHSMTIADHLKQPLANLQVACPDAQRLTQAHPALALVTASLREELRLNCDLDSLTDELTNRYEDLNLVFDNQEVATGLVDLQTALSQLADNAVSHLAQGMALILFPDRDIEIFRQQAMSEHCDMDGLKALAGAGLWSFMKRQEQTLVLNTDSSSDGLQLSSDYGVKVLLSPIHHGGGQALGYLLLAKSHTAENFSNGDRRIADVICQNAQSVLAAHFDALTGLLQRGAFESELAQAMAQDGHRRQPHVLVFVSVDRTAVINDAFGRAAGDLLLQQVAKVIDRNVRRADTVARLGGDEFAVLLRDAGSRDAQRLAQTISTAVRSITLGLVEGAPSISVSIGISPVAMTQAPDAVMSQAQIACDKAREGGGGKVHLFDNENELMAARHAQSQMVTTVQAALA